MHEERMQRWMEQQRRKRVATTRRVAAALFELFPLDPEEADKVAPDLLGCAMGAANGNEEDLAEIPGILRTLLAGAPPAVAVFEQAEGLLRRAAALKRPGHQVLPSLAVAASGSAALLRGGKRGGR